MIRGLIRLSLNPLTYDGKLLSWKAKSFMADLCDENCFGLPFYKLIDGNSRPADELSIMTRVLKGLYLAKPNPVLHAIVSISIDTPSERNDVTIYQGLLLKLLG